MAGPTKVVTYGLGGKFQSVRFVYHGYSPYQMEQIGAGTLTRGILPRIRQGQNVQDGPARALNAEYAKRKSEGKLKPRDGKQLGTNPIRDWYLSGRLMRSTRVIAKQENQCTLGATDNTINARLYYNNRRGIQFGVSPKDQVILIQEFDKHPPHTRAEVAK